jgi:hypothetical protein
MVNPHCSSFVSPIDIICQVAEMDAPQKLLENKESRFYGLAAEAGLVAK